MKSRKSWEEKMQKPSLPEVVVLEEDKSKTYLKGLMLIPTPTIIYEYLRTIPKGKVVKLSTLRADLAHQNNADYACPLTTGIFLRICSEYAEEQKAKGIVDIAPYWRVIRDDGTLIDKFPSNNQYNKLVEEGFELIPKGKNHKVKL